MRKREKQHYSLIQSEQPVEQRSLEQAIVLLSSIADLSSKGLRGQLSGLRLEDVREAFHLILHYFRLLSKRDMLVSIDPIAVEGIRDIMLLVGEAGKKLDQYTNLAEKGGLESVTHLEEYRKLQDFCQARISEQPKQQLTKWILKIAKKVMDEHSYLKLAADQLEKAAHTFIDLDAVKRDVEYELFFMRKEDGSRFFNPVLLRNMQLVCDFEDRVEGSLDTELPFDSVEWENLFFEGVARDILKAVRGATLHRFYHDEAKLKNNELSVLLNKAFMALMLCENAGRVDRVHAKKSCTEYFHDFQYYLSEALQCRYYHKLLAFPPDENKHVSYDLLKLTQTICRALFVNLNGYLILTDKITELVEKARSGSVGTDQIIDSGKQAVWNKIVNSYVMLNRVMKSYPNGPLHRVLDLLEKAPKQQFDPLAQDHLPFHCYDLLFRDHKIAGLRIPAPVYQEAINKCVVGDEFRSFLRYYTGEGKKHLLISLHNRTTWREHVRAVALEELQDYKTFADAISIVTLAVGTDFTHQDGIYRDVDDAKEFMDLFLTLFQDEHAGFAFPQQARDQLVAEFIPDCLHRIHSLFFNHRESLSWEERRSFIELFYLFLELKIIELVSPNSFSFTCKDGIDRSAVESVKLFVFLKMLQEPKLSGEEFAFIDAMLYAPALLLRYRMLQSDSFYRMVGAVKVIEEVRKNLGFSKFQKTLDQVFGGLYKMPLTEISVEMPHFMMNVLMQAA
jgi:hypothetical protein